MEAVRWIRALVPVAVVALLVGASGVSASRAADPPWRPPPCLGGPADPPRPETAAWYDLSPVLDASGTLVGQRLTVGAPGNSSRSVDLPPESFASGPLRGQLVVGDDDASRSRLRVIDLVRGCVRFETTEASVIRSALLAADAATLWEHRVDRTTRRDLGVWRRTDEQVAAVRVLPGLPADPEYGPTFTTDLRQSADGHLVVATCGVLACRTRILDPASGRVSAVRATGPAIGLATGRLVAYAACDWWPCPVLAIDPTSGARTTLVAESGPAELGGHQDADLVYEAPDGTLARIDLHTLARLTVRGTGLAPVRRGSTATAGVDLAPGAVLMAPGGHMSSAEAAQSVDPATFTVDAIAEARQ